MSAPTQTIANHAFMFFRVMPSSLQLVLYVEEGQTGFIAKSLKSLYIENDLYYKSQELLHVPVM